VEAGEQLAPIERERIRRSPLVDCRLETPDITADLVGRYIPRLLAGARSFMEGDMREALQFDPTWAEAVAWSTEDSSFAAAESTLVRLEQRPGLLPGERETVAFHMARRHNQAEQAYQLAHRRFAAGYVRWFAPLTFWALVTGRVHEALAASLYQDSTLALVGGPPDGPAYNYRGIALHQLGRYQDELQLAHEIARRFPTLLDVAHTHEALALAALGKVDSLRGRLAEWEAIPENAGAAWAGSRAYAAGQELMAHGHPAEGLAVLAETIPFFRALRRIEGYGMSEVAVLDWTGHLREARRLALAGLRSGQPASDSLDFIGYLADIALQQGRRSEAARYDALLATAAHTPSSAPEATFLRAMIAGRRGDRLQAVRLLEQARALGSNMTLHVITHREPELTAMRDYPPFRRFLEPTD
jgi:tetratricopeptide (TPR) repeat protein